MKPTGCRRMFPGNDHGSHLLVQQHSPVVEIQSIFWVLWAQHLLADSDGSKVETVGLVELTLGCEASKGIGLWLT